MKSRFIISVLVWLFLCLPAIGQKLSVRAVKSVQPFAPMIGRTGEIVHSLPGGRVIEKETANGKTSLYCIDDAGSRTKIYEGGPVDYFTHSRGGERICFQGQAEIIVKDLKTFEEFRIKRPGPIYMIWFASISADGRSVAYERTVKGSNLNSEIVTMDLISAKERLIGGGQSPKCSSSSDQIAFDIAEGDLGNWTLYLWICNSDGMNGRKLTSSVGMGGSFLKWSPDGKYVMDSDRSGNLRIVDVAEDKAVVIPPSALGEVPNCRKTFFSNEWSPDSKTVLAHVLVDTKITEEIAGWELYAVSVDGSKIEKIEISGLGMDVPVWLNNREILYRNIQAENAWTEVELGSDGN